MNENVFLLYCIIPVLAVTSIFFVKRKLLWIAPLISTAIYFIAYMAILRLSGMESPITKIFGYGEWRAFFLFAMLIQLVIASGFTAVAYFVAYIFKRKRTKTE